MSLLRSERANARRLKNLAHNLCSIPAVIKRRGVSRLLTGKEYGHSWHPDGIQDVNMLSSQY
jgi:hypothetical protein